MTNRSPGVKRKHGVFWTWFCLYVAFSLLSPFHANPWSHAQMIWVWSWSVGLTIAEAIAQMSRRPAPPQPAPPQPAPPNPELDAIYREVMAMSQERPGTQGLSEP